MVSLLLLLLFVVVLLLLLLFVVVLLLLLCFLLLYSLATLYVGFSVVTNVTFTALFVGFCFSLCRDV